MKLKTLLAGVVMGALCLSSCIKNFESPEVTALRNARADEIRALAELHRADATATTTLANAQAALLAAQTKVAEAQAALIAAQTETEQANAAQALAWAEAAQAQAEAALKQAEYEQELAELQHQIDMLRAQQDLQNAITQGQIAAADDLIELVNAYNAARDRLLDMEIQLFELENLLDRLEAGMIDPEAEAEAVVEYYESQIARIQAYIDAFKKYQTYSEEELIEMLDAARIALMDAQTVYHQKLQAASDAWTAYSNKRDDVNNNIYMDAFFAFVDPAWNFLSNYDYEHVNGFRSVPVDDEKYDGNYYSYGYYDTDGKLVAYWSYGTSAYAKDEEFYPGYNEDGTYPEVATWIPPTVKFFGYTVNAKAFEAVYTTRKTELKAALDAAKALDPADENAVKIAQENLDNLEKAYKAVTDALKDVDANKATFDKLVKAAETAYVDYVKAVKAEIDAEIALNAAQTEYDAIINASASYWDEHGTEWDVNDDIEYYEEMIAWYEYLLADALNDIENEYYDDVLNIVTLQEQIAELENRIVVQEQLVAYLEELVIAALGVEGEVE